jgi:hypothetical protein
MELSKALIHVKENQLTGLFPKEANGDVKET